MSIKSGRFRELVGTFATGCTVVTIDGDQLHGLTANAFSSVSLDPPLVLVCVDHETRTYDLLERGDVEGFTVNILSKAQQDLGSHFADITQLSDDPFETRTLDGVDTHAPVFDEDLAYLDCTIEDAHPAGDHTIYVGRVVEGDDLNPDADPLAFYQGKWGTVQTDE
jgi:flavin reductase (DIM6/NTAB) family NADH-FMN oxidoreductase RutF